jgi:outer membrane protein OmpA-like peptidoglycan-associated protein
MKCLFVIAFLASTASADKLKVATLGDFRYEDTRIHTFERAELKKLAQEWRRNSSWATITVEGHGYYSDNEEASIRLGQQRADHARALLIQYGVDPEMVVAVGHAQSQAGRDVDVIVSAYAPPPAWH